jgi:hypothetical protein
MSNVNLSTLAIVIGAIYIVLPLFGLLKPAAFGTALRRFPRYTPAGWLLMLAGTGWFLYYVSLETVSDFANIKTWLYYFFGAVGVGACLYVRDFLPVRGLAVVLLLLAKVTTDKARVIESDWRLVMVTLAYVWVFLGMWFTISPWRLRDLIGWATATEQRTRLLSGARLLFGLLVLALGLTVFRAAAVAASAGQ